MNQIQQITSDPLQSQTIALPDGSQLTFTLYFIPLQLGWFITNLIYNTANTTFQLNGLRVCNSPNMLHQFLNQIPFGIACISANSREPSLIQDFSSGASNLYLLSKAECENYAEFLADG